MVITVTNDVVLILLMGIGDGAYVCVFSTYSYEGHNNHLGYYDIYFVDVDNTSSVQGIMACEAIHSIGICHNAFFDLTLYFPKSRYTLCCCQSGNGNDGELAEAYILTCE